MIAHFFALLLAQAASASQPSATPASPAASAVAPAAPAAEPSASPGDIVIENSGSTNTAGYRVVVHPDATVDIRRGGVSTHEHADPAHVAHLLATVVAEAPLDAIPSGHCMRSVSFGSVTRVSYDGKTTGDLGCGTTPAARKLSLDVATLVGELHVNALEPGRRRPL
jgi:hypothetical protein